ncbi:unnamed protein product [Umbelopsis ramanniana]
MNELSTTNASQFNDLILVTVLVRTSQINEVSKLLSLLGALSYPLHRLDVAFLLTDATSGSHPVFEHMLSHNQHSFKSIVAYGKNMITDLPKEKAQVFDFQPLMRAQLARARNYLTRSALKDEHQWILAMDASLDDIPHDIIQQLMSVDVDVVVPNCMVKRDDGKIWGFEKSNWQDTELSLTMTDNPQEDYIFMEGYWEMQTHRRLLVDMPTDADQHAKIPLDGIGSCFSLSKASVHRTGVIYPPFPYRHQIDTEGFAQMAKMSGYGVYGLPGVQVLHAPEALNFD